MSRSQEPSPTVISQQASDQVVLRSKHRHVATDRVYLPLSSHENRVQKLNQEHESLSSSSKCISVKSYLHDTEPTNISHPREALTVKSDHPQTESCQSVSQPGLSKEKIDTGQKSTSCSTSDQLSTNKTTNGTDPGTTVPACRSDPPSSLSDRASSQLEADSNTNCEGNQVKEGDLRRQPHPPFRQAHSEVIMPSSISQRRQSLVTVQEKGYARLQMELIRAHKALERRDEEVDELRNIRERLMKEVSDFTASLFEEVNSQLNEAALSEQQARRQLKEANSKVEVLTAEVDALKDLVLTSTPSSPNKHLNPQIDLTNKKEKGGVPFWKTHRRSTSHHQFTKDSREMAEATEQHSLLKELDTVVFDEFLRWRLQPTLEFAGQFFVRVLQEDIQPCLNFRNVKLSAMLLADVPRNTLSIEPVAGDQSVPRKCALSESHKLCNYKIKFEGDDEWYPISQMSRNRITAVCDFYSYLRYIVQGLVKCSDKDIFAELVRLRNRMAQARLGLI